MVVWRYGGGHTKSGGDNHSNGGTEFHGETARRGVQSKLVSEIAHDVVTIGPDTNGDTGTTKDTKERVSLS
jgi:hypothetical protein